MDIELLSLDRLPLPSLGIYALLSVLAASTSLYYFWTESQIFYYELLSQQAEIAEFESGIEVGLCFDPMDFPINATIDSKYVTWQTIHWASQQPHCVWPLVNLAYCLLILLSHSVQKSVFGNLRASEQENVKDQFWNLVFYKVVFVFGVVNVQELEDAMGWCFFVSVIGFLQLARQLCKERHNYLILMNDCTRSAEIRRRRILGLLSFIFFASISLFVAVCGWYMGSSSKSNPDDMMEPLNEDRVQHHMSSSAYDFNLGLHSAIFMLSEIGLLIIQTLHALSVCIFDQVCSKHKNNSKVNEDTYANIAQSINFKFDLAALLFDLVHHVHMFVCCNLFLSMTSLIVSLQMRTRVRLIHAILKKRQAYMWLAQTLNQYPEAKLVAGEREAENCAICWDALTSQEAKSLPCHHNFHTTCLRKWLLVSMNCPTCRLSLLNEKQMKRQSARTPRRFQNPRPNGLWGFLQTGQTLLDLFGGWDPNEIYTEVPSQQRSVPLFGIGVQDWTVESQSDAETTTPRTEKKD